MNPVEIQSVVKILLQDSIVAHMWTKVASALEIPAISMSTLNSQYEYGEAGLYEVFSTTLHIWVSRMGKEATITKLVEVLRHLQLLDVAEKLEGYITNPGKHLITIQRIDAGAFGEVLKVRGLFDGVEYALKRISIGNSMKMPHWTKSSIINKLEHLTRLVREVHTMAKLQNPHVVTYMDAWFEGPLRKKFEELLQINSALKMYGEGTDGPSQEEIDTFICIKMELCDTNLEKWMDSNPLESRKFSISMSFIKQILEGLAYIHSEDFIHRDIKPKNILMDVGKDQFVIKIGDFGLARQVLESDTSLSAVLVPVRDFQSPEMARGDTYDRKTDVYSVGLIFLNLVYPFKSAKEQGSIFTNVRRGDREEYIKKLTCDSEYLDLLSKMLDRQSGNRPEAQEALDKLSKISN